MEAGCRQGVGHMIGVLADMLIADNVGQRPPDALPGKGAQTVPVAAGDLDVVTAFAQVNVDGVHVVRAASFSEPLLPWPLRGRFSAEPVRPSASGREE